MVIGKVHVTNASHISEYSNQIDFQLPQDLSARSSSRDRLTPRSKDKHRSKRQAGHVSDDEMLSARSAHKHRSRSKHHEKGGLDNPAYEEDEKHHRKHR